MVASFGEAWPGLRRPQGDHLLRLRSGPGASVLNNRREAASFRPLREDATCCTGPAQEPLDRTAPPLVVDQFLAEEATGVRRDGSPPEGCRRNIGPALTHLPLSCVRREDLVCRRHAYARSAILT